ncbi:metallophosphoesterase [Paraburkholderia sp. IMGN_8]|uniref:metallophosphoesterase n=1 Tax=Paraburkholderia sp. IMGN_8 TaxID=3136564 RepID=UPI003101B107
MRLQVASDLHHGYIGSGLATARRLTVSPEADVLVLAGNVHSGAEGISLYADMHVPVVYVHGNQELHGLDIDRARQALRKRAAATSVTFLECAETYIEGVRFLGCCLWTDYQLSSIDKVLTMSEADRYLVDHRRIRRGARKFLPQDAVRENQKARSWLTDRLHEITASPTVVVTHHAPCLRSIPESLISSPYAPSLASDLRNLLPLASLWIHGHIHNTHEYTVGETAVVCNARGYPWERNSFRRKFEPEFVIDIPVTKP